MYDGGRQQFESAEVADTCRTECWVGGDLYRGGWQWEKSMWGFLIGPWPRAGMHMYRETLRGPAENEDTGWSHDGVPSQSELTVITEYLGH